MSGRYLASHMGPDGREIRAFGEMAADAIEKLLHDERFMQQIERESGRPGVIVFRLAEESDLR